MNVYVIECNGYYKIGIAYDIKSRLSTLQSSCPYKLKLIAVEHLSSDEKARMSEKHIHNLLKDHRVRGEWFDVSLDKLFSVLKLDRSQKGFKIPHHYNAADYAEILKGKNGTIKIDHKNFNCLYKLCREGWATKVLTDGARAMLGYGGVGVSLPRGWKEKAMGKIYPMEEFLNACDRPYGWWVGRDLDDLREGNQLRFNFHA